MSILKTKGNMILGGIAGARSWRRMAGKEVQVEGFKEWFEAQQILEKLCLL